MDINNNLHPDLKIFGKDYVLEVTGENIEYYSYVVRLFKEIMELEDNVEFLNKLYKFVQKQNDELTRFLSEIIDQLEEAQIDFLSDKINKK